MAEKFSDRLTGWLPYVLGAQVVLFVVVGGVYLAKSWSRAPIEAGSPAAEEQDSKVSQSAGNGEQPAAPDPRENVRTLGPRQMLRPVFETHRVGRLPEGLEINVKANATLRKDSEGNAEILLHPPELGSNDFAWVNFLHEGNIISKMALAPREAGPVVRPRSFEWAVYEIEDSAPEMEINHLGIGHIVALPDGRAWLFATRPNGEDWVKLLAERPGFKQTAALVYPKPGERKAVRFEMQEQGPPFEHSLPEDVVFFVNVSRYGEFKERLNELRGVKLCQDPAMAPFVSHFLDAGKKSRVELQRETGVDLVNLCAAHTGQISIAARLPEWAASSEAGVGKARNQNQLIAQKTLRQIEPAWYFLSDIPGSRDSIEKMLQEVSQTGAADQMHLAITDNHVLYGAESAEEAGSLLSWLGKPPEPSFAKNPRLQEFRKRTGGPGDFEVFADLKPLLSYLNARRDVGDVTLPLGMATYWGGDRFQAIGFSFSIAQEPFETLWHLDVQTQNRPLLFTYVSLPARPLKPESWVPADIAGYYTFHWDHSFARAFLGYLKFLNVLGERLTVVTDLTESRGFVVPRMLLAWERRDVFNGDGLIQELQTFLRDATKKGHPETQERKGPKGQTIYVRDYGGQLEKELGPDKPVPLGQAAMTSTDTHFLLATHVELLEKVLNHQGPGLVDSPDFQRVARHFPDECSLIVYHTPEQNRLLFQALKSGRLPGMLQGTFTSKLMGGLAEALDGSKLPEYDAIKHFFSPSGGYAIMDDSGFHFRHFSLKGE